MQVLHEIKLRSSSLPKPFLDTMVFCNLRTHCQCQRTHHLINVSSIIIIIIPMLCFLLPSAQSLYFNFPQFGSNTHNITYHGDAASSNRVIELTKYQRDVPINDSVGRAIYSQPVHLWNSQTGWLADFTTHFSFIINGPNSSSYGSGLAFFLAANGSYIPPASGGGSIGLFSSNSSINSTESQLVAVEFDTHMNGWDPSADHIGIDVNSIVSKANLTWSNSIKNGSTANAWLSYNSSTKNLSVFLTYAKNPVYMGNSSLYYIVDLTGILPEWINIGFSAAAGRFLATHQILSWDFNSTFEEITVEGERRKEKKKKAAGMMVGLVVGGAVLIFGLICLMGYSLVMRRHKSTKDEDNEVDMSMDDEFARGTGPKRFTYNELVVATNNFSEDAKLGKGEFKSVYKGFLSELGINVAIKRVLGGSKQGKKDFVSAVKIISQLQHRNLVQFLGWCYERGDYLLVYEFVPNGSLDSHLFGGKSLLSWAVRYKIVEGLASSLQYMHEECMVCLVHGVIKSSNVMLDSGFNAKVGGFSLARLVDHELRLLTMVIIGTMGYLAPECITTGKASKESDVYSFGILSLEIACGRRPLDLNEEPSKVMMVEWVWELYGRGELLTAADERLHNDFDVEEMERLLVLGLWCVHPDHNSRPSMREVMNVLSWDAPLPSLPSKMSVPSDFILGTNVIKSYATRDTSSLDFTASSASSSTALSDSPQNDI